MHASPRTQILYARTESQLALLTLSENVDVAQHCEHKRVSLSTTEIAHSLVALPSLGDEA